MQKPNRLLEKIKQNLPSRQFVKVIAICGGIVVIVLIVGSYFGSHSIFHKNSGPLVEANGTISELLVQDSNANGIPDWEESLWGFDPKGDGVENKKGVDQKKAAANIAPIPSNSPANETDRFSQTLLSTILALNQSGSLTTAALTKLSESVSNEIDVKRTNMTSYTLDDLIVVPASVQAKATYAKNLKKILDTYENLSLGSELALIYQGTSPGGESALPKLTPYAEAYTDIGQKMLKLRTPANINLVALDLINTSTAMGDSIPRIQNLYSDAISGIIGVGDYIKASNISDVAAKKMKAYLSL